MSRSHLVCALSAILLFSASSFGAYVPLTHVFDEFDGNMSGPVGDVVPRWLEPAVDFYTASGCARTSNDFALATFNQATPLQLGDWISVDARHSASKAGQYAGLVLGYKDLANNVIVKLQDFGGTGAFNRLYFRYGNGSSSQAWWNTTAPGALASFEILPTTFTEARLRARLFNDAVQVQIDHNADGNWDVTYTRGGVPVGQLGDGFGLAGKGSVQMDNFGGYQAPEPTAALLLSLGGLALLRRGRSWH